jgi:hypothetical protein
MAGTLVANTINTDTGLFNTNNAYLGIAKAWVNYKATATVGIRSSFNVSSVTYNSVGNYTVNFTTAMADANYCVTGAAGGYNGGSSASSNSTLRINAASGATYSTTAVQVTSGFVDGGNTDYLYMCVAIHGN